MGLIKVSQARNTAIDLRIIFCMITGLLLSTVVKNVEAGNVVSRETQHQVEISGFVFIPKELRVYAGDTITWVNRDIVPHNIIDVNNQERISADLATGEAYTFVVKKPMLYQCGLHPSMQGKLLLADFP